MEENKEELEILKEIINQMKLTKERMKECDTVTVTEYNIFEMYLNELEDRAMKLEIKINGCIIEEV